MVTNRDRDTGTDIDTDRDRDRDTDTDRESDTDRDRSFPGNPPPKRGETGSGKIGIMGARPDGKALSCG